MRITIAAALVGLVVFGGIAGPAMATGSAVTTAVTVEYLGLADFSVSASTVQPRLASGFTARPCFGGGNGQADVVVVATEERFASLPDVPDTPVRSLSLLTCADPPPAYARADANEPPWYNLGSWTDSADYRSFLSDHDLPAEPARLTFSGDAHDFSFEARDTAGVLLAAGSVVSPGVPTPPFTSCTPTRNLGRIIGVSGSTVAALDWDKTEATCSAVSSLHWDATSPLAALLGSGNQSVFSFVSDVTSASYTFRRRL